MARKRTVGSNAEVKMKRKAYEQELRKLQVELCHLQDWVKKAGARIIILFEGRDAAGKGGTIKAITEREASLKHYVTREQGDDNHAPTGIQRVPPKGAAIPTK